MSAYNWGFRVFVMLALSGAVSAQTVIQRDAQGRKTGAVETQ